MSKTGAKRIDQWLANLGYCSRRSSAEWLRAGRVTVDGKPTKDGSLKVDAGRLLVDGEPLDQPEGLLILMNKPTGLVCSHDEREGPQVYQLLPERWLRRNPQPITVGRLDKDTSGCLLITDDGRLAHDLTSPKHKVEKVYEVTVDKPLQPYLIDLFAAGGLMLDNDTKPCLPAKLEIRDTVQATLILTEGRYHQVRRMFAAEGWTVTALHRSRFGAYTLAGLNSGEWRLLNS